MQNSGVHHAVTNGGGAAIGDYRSQVSLLKIIYKTSNLDHFICQTNDLVDLHHVFVIASK